MGGKNPIFELLQLNFNQFRSNERKIKTQLIGT